MWIASLSPAETTAAQARFADDLAGALATSIRPRTATMRKSEHAVILEIGNHLETDTAHYPDIDLIAALIDGKSKLTHRDGTPYA